MSIMKQYQDWQDTTSWYKHSGEQDTLELTYLALGVTGEAGEFADTLKKLIRKDGGFAWERATEEMVNKLVDELGDVMWYIVRVCTFLNITPEELVLMNVCKLYDRLHERSESGLKHISWPFDEFGPLTGTERCTRIMDLVFKSRKGQTDE